MFLVVEVNLVKSMDGDEGPPLPSQMRRKMGIA